MLALKAPGDREPVLAGKHQVQYDQVGGVIGEPGIHRLAVLDGGNVESLLPQVKRQELAGLLVVVHDQQM